MRGCIIRNTATISILLRSPPGTPSSNGHKWGDVAEEEALNEVIEIIGQCIGISLTTSRKASEKSSSS